MLRVTTHTQQSSPASSAADRVAVAAAGGLVPHPRWWQASRSCAVVLQSYLEDFREEIGVKRSDKSVAYTALNKDSHVLEVPESLGRKIPTTYTACAGKKGFRRYTSEDLQELAAGHAKTCQGLEAAQLSILSSITRSAFGEKREMWLQVCSLVQAACEGALSVQVSVGRNHIRTQWTLRVAPFLEESCISCAPVDASWHITYVT